MRTNFPTRLITASTIASLARLASAQLPRQCFYVLNMFGAIESEAELLSNLPTLMTMFKPGMRVNDLVAQMSADKQELTGLQVNLTSPDSLVSLALPLIGSRDSDAWLQKEVGLVDDFQPDAISILSSDDLGVCDVILHQGTTSSKSLASAQPACTSGAEGIEVDSFQLPEETPLVGFHGLVDAYGLVSLGPILLDTIDPMCQQPLPVDQIS